MPEDIELERQLKDAIFELEKARMTAQDFDEASKGLIDKLEKQVSALQSELVVTKHLAYKMINERKEWKKRAEYQKSQSDSYRAQLVQADEGHQALIQKVIDAISGPVDTEGHYGDAQPIVDRVKSLLDVLQDIRTRLLDRAIGQSTLIDSLTRANLLAIIEDALDSFKQA